MLPESGLRHDEQQGLQHDEQEGLQRLEQHEQHDLQQHVQSRQSKTWTELELLAAQLEQRELLEHGLRGQHEQQGQREQQGLREQLGQQELEPLGLEHRVSLQRCMSIRTELESERRLQWEPNEC